jgi:hypothetical protein
MAIRRATEIAQRAREAMKARSELLVYMRLASLLGFTWVWGLLQNALEHPVVRYAFIVCNASQGVFIFVAFVCKQSVFRQLKDKMITKKKDPTTQLSQT